MTKPNKTKTLYYIYILECSNGAYYTGYTTNLERRYQEHVEGSSKCKYTRSFPPVRMVASWKIGNDLSEVLKIEQKIKTLTRKDKERLIANPQGISECYFI